MALDERTRTFLLIALQSKEPGEVANAMAMVNKALAKAGKDAYALVDSLLGKQQKTGGGNFFRDSGSNWQDQNTIITLRRQLAESSRRAALAEKRVRELERDQTTKSSSSTGSSDWWSASSYDGAEPDWKNATAQQAAQWALHNHKARINTWETGFLTTISAWSGKPTERQMEILVPLIKRLRKSS